MGISIILVYTIIAAFHVRCSSYIFEMSTVHVDAAPVLVCNAQTCSQTHLGHGIYINTTVVDAAMARTRESQFIKELAVAVFGIETLRSSSVTGTRSRRTQAPAKPPLNPTKLLAIQGRRHYRATMHACAVFVRLATYVKLYDGIPNVNVYSWPPIH